MKVNTPMYRIAKRMVLELLIIEIEIHEWAIWCGTRNAKVELEYYFLTLRYERHLKQYKDFEEIHENKHTRLPR